MCSTEQLLVRSPLNGSQSSWSCVLPDDLIIEVASLLNGADVLSLALTSRRSHHLVSRILYALVVLDSDQACQSALKYLSSHPEAARFVKKLELTPTTPVLATKAARHITSEHTLFGMIERLAEHLVCLKTFIWNGLSFPRDELWRKLRCCCPDLCNIRTSLSYGLDPLAYTLSPLFDFSSLYSFGVVFQRDHTHSSQSKCLPASFWNLLRNNAPCLEELSLTSAEPEGCHLDVTPLFDFNFPKLGKLAFGPFHLLGDVHQQQHVPLVYTALKAFLISHGPRLQSLSYQGPCLNCLPEHFPSLKRFKGTATQVRLLPNVQKLEHLELPIVRETIHHDWVISDMYRLTPNIRSFTTCIRGGDACHLFERIPVALLKLSQLSVTILQYPSPRSWQRFLSALKSPKHLHSLRLIFSDRCGSDEYTSDMNEKAGALFMTVPNLEYLYMHYFHSSIGEFRHTATFDRAQSSPVTVTARHAVERLHTRSSVHRRITLPIDLTDPKFSLSL